MTDPTAAYEAGKQSVHVLGWRESAKWWAHRAWGRGRHLTGERREAHAYHLGVLREQRLLGLSEDDDPWKEVET